MKIVLVEPTDRLLLTPSLALRGNTLEPYACEVLGAYLEQRFEGEATVKIYQQGELDDKELASFLISEDLPDLIGFSVLTCNYHRTLQIAYYIKSKKPSVRIVFGGQHPSIDTQNVIENDYVDFVISGEGEVTLGDLIDALNHRKFFTDIPGLAYKEAGKIIINSPRKRIENLDMLPLAKRDAEYLTKVNKKYHGKLALPDCRNWNLCYPAYDKQAYGVAQIQYSRGCKFKCSFCVSPTLWCESTEPNPNKLTYKSAGNVAREISQLKKDARINFFYFNDVTFNSNRNKMRELCNALLEEQIHKEHPFDIHEDSEPDYNAHWFCLARIGVTEEDAQLLAKAGCSKIGFGIESFDNKVLRQYRKGYSIGQIESTLRNTDNVGIINRVYIVLGAPQESDKTIETTLQGLKEHPIDQIRVAFAVPYPGTPAYKDDTWRNAIINTDYSRWTEDEPVINCKILLDDMIEKRKWLIESFYNSPEYKNRVKNKINRFPYLKHSYEVFSKELRMLSGNKINIW